MERFIFNVIESYTILTSQRSRLWYRQSLRNTTGKIFDTVFDSVCDMVTIATFLWDFAHLQFNDEMPEPASAGQLATVGEVAQVEVLGGELAQVEVLGGELAGYTVTVQAEEVILYLPQANRSTEIEAEVGFLMEHWEDDLSQLTKAQILSTYSRYVRKSWTKKKILEKLPGILQRRYNYLMSLTW